MTSAHVRRLEHRVTRTAARFVEQAAATGAGVGDLAGMKLPWYAVRNETGTDPHDEVATVFVFEEIGGSFGISADTFARDLAEITAPTIHVRINSPGGSVFDAIAIYNALLHHPARIVVYVDSLAASAASVIAMAGDEIVMMPGSQMMIHEASMIEDGDAADMAKASTFLGRQSDNVAEFYQRRAGGDVAEWRDLMLAETWMYAAEAVTMGLADRVEVPTPTQDAPESDLVQRMARAHGLGQFRYAGRGQAPVPTRRDTTTAVVACRDRTEPPSTALRPPVPTPSARATALTDRYHAAARERAQCVVQRCDRPSKRRAGENGTRARAIVPARIDLRDSVASGLLHFTGHASMYEYGYELWDEFGPYTEIVSAGAGAVSLARADLDVPLVLGHDELRRMARTTTGTLALAEDDLGLSVNAPGLDPADADVAYIVPKLRSGLVDEMSFAFRIIRGQWSADYSEYRIAEYDIHRGDVAIVGYGANPATDGALRQPAAPAKRDGSRAKALLELAIAR